MAFVPGVQSDYPPLQGGQMYGSAFMGDLNLTQAAFNAVFGMGGGNALISPAIAIGAAGFTGGFLTGNDLVCRNLLVDTGILLCLSGNRIFCQGTLTVNGEIWFWDHVRTGASHAAGSVGGAAAGGAGGLSGITGSTIALGPGGNGGAGGTAAGNQGTLPTLTAGGFGGAGGAGSGGAGGAQLNTLAISGASSPDLSEGFGTLFAAYSTLMQALYTYSVGGAAPSALSQIYGGAGGSGGGGDATHGGGGGGAGGAMGAIFARYITGPGAVRSKGAAGGAGNATGNNGGGGGGGGGCIYVVSNSVVLAATTASVGIAGSASPVVNTPPFGNNLIGQIPGGPTFDVSGGAGGAGVGTGVAGSSGGAGQVIMIPG